MKYFVALFIGLTLIACGSDKRTLLVDGVYGVTGTYVHDAVCPEGERFCTDDWPLSRAGEPFDAEWDVSVGGPNAYWMEVVDGTLEVPGYEVGDEVQFYSSRPDPDCPKRAVEVDLVMLPTGDVQVDNNGKPLPRTTFEGMGTIWSPVGCEPNSLNGFFIEVTFEGAFAY